VYESVTFMNKRKLTEQNRGNNMHKPVIQAALPSIGALAYLGDAVHSLCVRRALVGRGISRAEDLNRAALAYVTAEAQAKVYRALLPSLAEDEQDVARRAQNSSHLRRPRHASVADYRAATALEAVLGMLDYLGDAERIAELFAAAEAVLFADDHSAV
jgi:ribonuclease-3 family protein